MPSGLCRLCERQSELQLSHVLPAFAYRWLRESSGNGHLRNSQEPNKRAQDGPKFYWLCAECEELFSRNETAFAGRLFHPYLKASGQIFPYSSWLIHFCTSVSWRVLRFYRDEGHLQTWEPEALARVDSAESTGETCSSASDQILARSSSTCCRWIRFLRRVASSRRTSTDTSCEQFNSISAEGRIQSSRTPSSVGSSFLDSFMNQS
jgi:hypothetical protein